MLPGKIYEYITTAAGILILFNWAFIILSALRILEIKIWGKILAFFGVALILAAISGTLMEKNIRMGFFVSLFACGLSLDSGCLCHAKKGLEEGELSSVMLRQFSLNLYLRDLLRTKVALHFPMRLFLMLL